MSLAHLLLRQAQQTPGRAAIFNGTVVLFMRNHPRYLEILWAAWWAGLLVVPVNAKLHAREVEWIIDNAQARWAFVAADVAPETLAGLECQIDVETPQSDDVEWLFYTSGTTGRPKGVMLTHRNLMTIISGGSNIYPREVEAAVVGASDPEWGEVVVAFVVAQPGTSVTPHSLDQHCLELIARFKRPKRCVLVDSLPKNAYGKVLKTELRSRLSGPQNESTA